MKKIDKPWGFEELIEINDVYVLKKLTMRAGHRCSLQYHSTKKETIYVIQGVLKITVGETLNTLSEALYYPGDHITIRSGLIHRMEGVVESIYLEASTPELNDVIRLDDDYRRNIL